jgi:hypothetical protein
MTVDKCLSFCRDKGKPFAGLQFGIECYCGSSQQMNKLERVELESCNLVCKGDNK